MLHFSPLFRLGSISAKQSPTFRVLGETCEQQLIIQCTQKQGATIELLSADGTRVCLLTFGKPTDFINASVPPTRDIVHGTYRVPTKTGFRFVAMLYSVGHPSVYRETKSDAPVDGIFLDGHGQRIHHLVQIVDGKSTHYIVTAGNKRIDIEKLRGGMALRNVIHWQYDQMSRRFWTISDSISGSLTEFDLRAEVPSVTSQRRIQLLASNVLPDELALCATSSIVLPLYRSNNHRFFVWPFHSAVCIVQQLFEGEQSSCAFAVAVYPSDFDRTVFIPGLGADLPLCFSGVGSIVCVFVPNYFLCVINISRFPPAISILPKQFAASVCGRCCANCPSDGHVIDIDSCDIFGVAFDFSSFPLLRSIMTDVGWDVLVQVVASSRVAHHLANMLHLTELARDDMRFVRCVHSLFQYFGAFRRNGVRSRKARRRAIAPSFSTPNLEIDMELAGQPLRKEKHIPPAVFEHLADIEREFPSADGRSRRAAFRTLVDAFLNGHTIELAARRAMDELCRQNGAVLVLREAIDLWVHDFAPSDFEQLKFGIALHSETVAGSFPAIPCLKEELGPFVVSSCSRPIVNALAEGIATGTVAMNEEEVAEAVWWKERVPTYDKSELFEGSTSSSIQSMRLERSRRSSIDYGWAIDASLPAASLSLSDLALDLIA